MDLLQHIIPVSCSNLCVIIYIQCRDMLTNTVVTCHCQRNLSKYVQRIDEIFFLSFSIVVNTLRFSCTFCIVLVTFGKPKGQLISKCPYEKSVASKIPTKLFLDFCPEIFCSSMGASWKLFGLPVGFLIYDITY